MVPMSDARFGSHILGHRRAQAGSHILGHRRAPVACVAVLGAALLLAACGSGSPGTGTGSGTSAESLTNPVATAYKFSACMRQHGVADFPDPRVTSSPGQQRIAIR